MNRKVQPFAAALRFPVRERSQHVDRVPPGRVTVQFVLGRLVDLQIRRPHQDVDVGQVADLVQFLAGELGLRDPAAGQDVHVLHRAGGQFIQHMLRHVGGAQPIDRRQQHPGHVQCDIARTDDSDTGCGQSDSVDGGIGVPAVPGDELSGRDAARQVLAGHRQPPIGARAAGHHHGVVVGAELREGDVLAESDIAQEPDGRPLHHLAAVAR